jgi:hypothetical protein
MTQLEIYLLLEQIFDQNFLEKFVLIKEKEKEYQLSEFFKTTKIKLLDLYKEYESYYKYNYDVSWRFNKILQELDYNTLQEQLSQVLEKILDAPKIKQFLEELTESFDIKDLKDNQEELKDSISSLKK